MCAETHRGCSGSASHGSCQWDCCGLGNPRCSAVVTAGLAGGASAVSSPGDSMGLLVVRLGAWVTAVLVATAGGLARGLHAAAGGPLGLDHWSLLWGSLLLVGAGRLLLALPPCVHGRGPPPLLGFLILVLGRAALWLPANLPRRSPSACAPCSTRPSPRCTCGRSG